MRLHYLDLYFCAAGTTLTISLFIYCHLLVYLFSIPSPAPQGHLPRFTLSLYLSLVTKLKGAEFSCIYCTIICSVLSVQFLSSCLSLHPRTPIRDLPSQNSFYSTILYDFFCTLYSSLPRCVVLSGCIHLLSFPVSCIQFSYLCYLPVCLCIYLSIVSACVRLHLLVYIIAVHRFGRWMYLFHINQVDEIPELPESRVPGRVMIYEMVLFNFWTWNRDL